MFNGGYFFLFIYLIMFNRAGWYKVILLFKLLIYLGLVFIKRLLESNNFVLFLKLFQSIVMFLFGL